MAFVRSLLERIQRHNKFQTRQYRTQTVHDQITARNARIEHLHFDESGAIEYSEVINELESLALCPKSKAEDDTQAAAKLYTMALEAQTAEEARRLVKQANAVKHHPVDAMLVRVHIKNLNRIAHRRATIS